MNKAAYGGFLFQDTLPPWGQGLEEETVTRFLVDEEGGVLAGGGSLESVLATATRLHKMADVGRFAAGLMHDMRTLTTHAQYYLSRRDATGVVSPENVKHAEEVILKVSEICGSLVRYAKGTISHKEIDPVLLAEKLVNLARPTLRLGIRIAFSSQVKTSRVMGSHSELEQVLINLIGNACQSITETSGDIVVTVFDPEYELGQGSGYIAIRVEDTGKGMDQDTLSHISQPFFTTKANEGGSGLGLYVTRKIVTAHSGLISVKSKPGEGSAFTAYLPTL